LLAPALAEAVQPKQAPKTRPDDMTEAPTRSSAVVLGYRGEIFYRLVGRHACAINAAAGSRSMLSYLEKFETVITRVLLVMMAGVVLLATVELGWILGKDVVTPPVFLLEIEELLELFGQFLLVLIGIELLHTVKVYIESREIHLEAMLAVALIAVARKIIVLEPKELPEGTLLGVAAMVLALTFGYYLVRRDRREKGDSDAEKKG
jgi:uncharacterized membrane protein (DUF373 family)